MEFVAVHHIRQVKKVQVELWGRSAKSKSPRRGRDAVAPTYPAKWVRGSKLHFDNLNQSQSPSTRSPQVLLSLAQPSRNNAKSDEIKDEWELINPWILMKDPLPSSPVAFPPLFPLSPTSASVL